MVVLVFVIFLYFIKLCSLCSVGVFVKILAACLFEILKAVIITILLFLRQSWVTLFVHLA